MPRRNRNAGGIAKKRRGKSRGFDPTKANLTGGSFHAGKRSHKGLRR